MFLGTGTPNPDPKHQGICVAIIVNGESYLVDAGPGVVRQATAATQKGVKGISAKELKRIFITHLHSDHTLGLPDVMFTPALAGRDGGLKIFGPPGIADMVNHIEIAWREDQEIRFHGGEPAIKESYKMEVTEIKPGYVYKDENVKVTAFQVDHGKWKYAYGLKFETPDRVIVLSGDTTYSSNLIEYAKGCDLLIHEVYSEQGLKKRDPKWQNYHSSYHTSGPDLGRLATLVAPKLLLLFHELPFGEPPEQILNEVKSQYKGEVVQAQDLDIY